MPSSAYQRGSAAGSNMMLAAVLAVLSYVPFEWVAKGSLVVAVFLFVIDPIPPVTRLVAVISVLVVALLSRVHRRWLAAEQQQQQQQQADDVTIVTNNANIVTEEPRRRRVATTTTTAASRRVQKED